MTELLVEMRILERLLGAWPIESWRDTTVLVGVSGGPDSVALLRLMSQLKCKYGGAGRLVVAHFDHGWRSDSSVDAEFVRQLAKELKLDFRLGVHQADAKHGKGRNEHFSEEHARHARYAFFLPTALQCGARFVAIGHTADDQMETIVHHFVRGSGLRGLSGMPKSRPLHEAVTLVRPLLQVQRSELLELLQSWHQAYRHDPTNESRDYKRAQIRMDVIPALRAVYGNADSAILRLGSIAGETSEFLASSVQPILTEAIVRDFGDGVELDVVALRHVPPLLIREALMQLWRSKAWPLQDMTFDKWNALAQITCSSHVRTENLPGHVVASSDGRLMRIVRRQSG